MPNEFGHFLRKTYLEHNLTCTLAPTFAQNFARICTHTYTHSCAHNCLEKNANLCKLLLKQSVLNKYFEWDMACFSVIYLLSLSLCLSFSLSLFRFLLVLVHFLINIIKILSTVFSLLHHYDPVKSSHLDNL